MTEDEKQSTAIKPKSKKYRKDKRTNILNVITDSLI